MSAAQTNRDWLFVKHPPQSAAPNAPLAAPKVERILQAVSQAFDTTPALLRGPRRARELALARFAAVALVLEFCPELSLPAIGRLMGGRDHTTIIHARRRAGDLLLPDRHSAAWRECYATARTALIKHGLGDGDAAAQTAAA